VENHIKWIDAAKFLGCHSIRVNLKGTGTPEELTRFSVDALGSLSEYGANNKIGVIVETMVGFRLMQSGWLMLLNRLIILFAEHCQILTTGAFLLIRQEPGSHALKNMIGFRDWKK
jgi:hypothetical protein